METCYAGAGAGANEIDGSSCISMQIIGRMVHTLLFPESATAAAVCLKPISPIANEWLDLPSLCYFDIFIMSTSDSADVADLIDDQMIVNSVHEISRCFTKAFTSSARASPSSSLDLQQHLPALVQELRLTLHASHCLDVFMYWMMMTLLEGEPAAPPSPHNPKPISGERQRERDQDNAKKRKWSIAEELLQSNDNNRVCKEAVDMKTYEEVIEILMYANCQDICKSQIYEIGNSSDYNNGEVSSLRFRNCKKVLFASLLSGKTDGHTAVIASHQQKFYQSKQCLTQLRFPTLLQEFPTEILITPAAKDTVQFLLLIMLRCSILDILLLASSSSSSSSPSSSSSSSSSSETLSPPSNQSSRLFQDLCEYCIMEHPLAAATTTTAAVTNASDAKGETTTSRSLPTGANNVALAAYLLSLILTEIELLTAHPNTFGKFLSSLVQGKRAAVSSGLEQTAAYHESDNNGSPAQVLKAFFNVQQKNSGSSFALLVAFLKKEADDDEPPIDISIQHMLSN
jgi:hypothetical protein